jgi:hypothetical protein
MPRLDLDPVLLDLPDFIRKPTVLSTTFSNRPSGRMGTWVILLASLFSLMHVPPELEQLGLRRTMR